MYIYIRIQILIIYYTFNIFCTNNLDSGLQAVCDTENNKNSKISDVIYIFNKMEHEVLDKSGDYLYKFVNDNAKNNIPNLQCDYNKIKNNTENISKSLDKIFLSFIESKNVQEFFNEYEKEHKKNIKDNLKLLSENFLYLLKKAYNIFLSENCFLDYFKKYEITMKIITGKNEVGMQDFLELNYNAIEKHLNKKLLLLDLLQSSVDMEYIKLGLNNDENVEKKNFLKDFIFDTLDIMSLFLEFRRNINTDTFEKLNNLLYKLNLSASNAEKISYGLSEIDYIKYSYLTRDNYKFFFDYTVTGMFIGHSFELILKILDKDNSQKLFLENNYDILFSNYFYKILLFEMKYPNDMIDFSFSTNDIYNF